MYPIALLIRYKYLILFPLACAEGPVLAVLSGYLIHKGYLLLLPTFLIFIAGDFFPDTAYYAIGRSFNASAPLIKLRRFVRISDQRVAALQKLWAGHTGIAVFLGKLSYGLSIPVIMSAGMARVPYRKFILFAVPTTIFQYSVFISIGYYVAYSYTYIGTYIKYGGILISIIFAVLVTAYILIGRYAKRKIEQMEAVEASNRLEEIDQ